MGDRAGSTPVIRTTETPYLESFFMIPIHTAMQFTIMNGYGHDNSKEITLGLLFLGNPDTIIVK